MAILTDVWIKSHYISDLKKKGDGGKTEK